MTALTFSSAGEGRFRVGGRLGFDTVHTIWDLSREGLAGAVQPSVDLSEVTYVDSAGLALVLEWVGWAQARGKRLRLMGVPAKLMDLARISEVDAILGSTAAIAA